MAQRLGKLKSKISITRLNLEKRKLSTEKRAISPERRKELNLSLIKAVQNDRANAIEHLLDAGADIESITTFSKMTLLIWTAALGNSETVKLLIERGANIDAKDNKGWTALMYAKWHGNKETVKFLSLCYAKKIIGDEETDRFISSFRECTSQ
ncbi:MAG: ankyrin repeat domain-containing protein [Candidatus Micrarchaeota archaeon]|nr:ankyrin repeat domain-containing protein [Candidatus Micrarchaeota archaeon]